MSESEGIEARVVQVRSELEAWEAARAVIERRVREPFGDQLERVSEEVGQLERSIAGTNEAIGALDRETAAYQRKSWFAAWANARWTFVCVIWVAVVLEPGVRVDWPLWSLTLVFPAAAWVARAFSRRRRE